MVSENAEKKIEIELVIEIVAFNCDTNYFRTCLPVAYCYILYSSRIDRFYIGMTDTSVEERLRLHNAYHYPGSWSAKGVPWSLFFVIECASHWQALCIESHIKFMKSKTYIRNLAKYPEMVEKLKEKYPF